MAADIRAQRPARGFPAGRCAWARSIGMRRRRDPFRRDNEACQGDGTDTTTAGGERTGGGRRVPLPESAQPTRADGSSWEQEPTPSTLAFRLPAKPGR
jgi:hypothetical protein